MTKTDHFRQLILQRLEELGHRLQDIEGELDQPKPKDLEDQAIDLEDDEVLERLGLAAQDEVRLLNQALERIEKGEYGICRECGERILDARLEAVPTAQVCRACIRPQGGL